MRKTSAAVAATFVLALISILSTAPQPAEAGQACSRLGLPNNCVKGNDLKARIALRELGRDGRLQIRDADNETAFNLDGSSSNVTNLFSNLEDESNGLVKAWAQIAANGAIEACWRCNTDPAQTRRITTGIYEVDFTPLATDISGRRRSTSLNITVGAITSGGDPGRCQLGLRCNQRRRRPHRRSFLLAHLLIGRM